MQTTTVAPLDESTVAQEPITQAQSWWNDVQQAKQQILKLAEAAPHTFSLLELLQDLPNAMHVTSCNAQTMQPSNRMVLCKAVEQRGVVFFSNYESRKAQDFASNSKVALTFYWPIPCKRQVRMEGIIEMLPEQESDDYFASRPLGSQIGNNYHLVIVFFSIQYFQAKSSFTQ